MGTIGVRSPPFEEVVVVGRVSRDPDESWSPIAFEGTKVDRLQLYFHFGSDFERLALGVVLATRVLCTSDGNLGARLRLLHPFKDGLSCSHEVSLWDCAVPHD